MNIVKDITQYIVTLEDQTIVVDASSYDSARAKAARYFIQQFGLDAQPWHLGKLLKVGRQGAREVSPLPSFVGVSEEDKQWLTGFIEGDGCIQFSDGRPSIDIGQTDERILVFIQELVKSGKLWSGKPSRVAFSGFERCNPIIKAIAPYVVSQKTARDIKTVFGIWIEQHKPTMPWICGFWDAEGSFSLNGPTGFAVALGQKDVNVLEEVREQLGGRIYDGNKTAMRDAALWLRKDEAKGFIPDYLRYSHNPKKREELLALLYYFASGDASWALFYNKLGELKKI